jgi:putative chitobiose transport system substrate-binding protein
MKFSKIFGAGLVFTTSIAALSLFTVGAQEKKQLEFVTTSLQSFADFFNPLVEKYNKANPAQNLKWTDLPQASIQPRVLAGVAAGNPPDAIQMNSTQVLELAQQGALLPLNNLLSKEQLAIYQKQALTAFSFEGKVYALPDYASPRVVLFNTEILKKAGLEGQQLPRTMGDIIAWAKIIKDKTGLYGFSPLIANVDFLKVFQEQGLPLFSDDRKKAVFNSSAHVAILSQYMDLRKKDYFAEDAIRKGFTAGYELYSAGKLGIAIMGPTFVPRLQKDNEAVYKVSVVAPHPISAGQVAQASTFSYAVPKGVSDPKAAAQLAFWLTNDEQQLAFSKRAGTTFPTTIKAARDPFFNTGGDSLIDKSRAAAAKTMKSAKELSVFVPNASVLNKAFKDNIEAALFGQKTAKAALDEIVKIWNANL